MTEENKEKINSADTAEKVVELNAKYENDKAQLKEVIKKKDSIVVDLSEQLRRKNNQIDNLQKDLEEERQEIRLIRQVNLEKKEAKNQTTFKEEFQRLQNQKQQANTK